MPAFQALRDTPDDPAAWRVLADQLEELGDDRAEPARLEARRLTAADDERPTVEASIQELLRTREPGWRRALGLAHDDPVTFRGGFMHSSPGWAPASTAPSCTRSRSWTSRSGSRPRSRRCRAGATCGRSASSTPPPVPPRPYSPPPTSGGSARWSSATSSRAAPSPPCMPLPSRASSPPCASRIRACATTRSSRCSPPL